MNDFDASEDLADLAADARHYNRQFRQRLAHPDSQDPEFSGDDEPQGEDE